MSASAELTPLDDEQRTNRLVVHLARLVQRGATVVDHHGTRAIVRLKDRPNFVPNIVIAISGLLLFAIAHDVLFLAAIALAIYGWHRKQAAANVVREVLVRVDELGVITEVELSASPA